MYLYNSVLLKFFKKCKENVFYDLSGKLGFK